jgi:hypothetical protein
LSLAHYIGKKESASGITGQFNTFFSRGILADGSLVVARVLP